MAAETKDFLILSVEDRTAKNGKPFKLVKARDEEGKDFDLYIWKDFDKLTPIPENVYSLTADFNSEFPELKDMVISTRKVTEFVGSIYSLEEGLALLDSMLSQITDPDFKELNNRLFKQAIKEKFVMHVAAVRWHHTRMGALLQHTNEVFEGAKALAKLPMYEGYIDYQTVLEGALLHDFGKLFTHDVSSIGQNSVTKFEMLAGHLSLGSEIIAKNASGLNKDKIEHLKHIIRAHHLRQDWDAVVQPATIEAYLVFVADYMSANLDRFRDTEFDEATGLGSSNGRASFVKFVY